MDNTYKINSPAVVSETLDGETIAIHFETGNYYSMKGLGVIVWDAIINGVSCESIAKELTEDEGDQELLLKKINLFVENLLEEKLAVHENSPSPSPYTFEFDGGYNPMDESSTIKLNTYTDMSEVLLLDPIHDVSKDGWPTKNDTKV